MWLFLYQQNMCSLSAKFHAVFSSIVWMINVQTFVRSYRKWKPNRPTEDPLYELTCYNVQEPPVSYIYSWWTRVIVCSWPCRPEGKRILSNVVWRHMVISIWIEWLYAVFTTHTYCTCGYHDSLILFQLYHSDNLVTGLCQSWSPPCYKLVARVSQCIISPCYKLVTWLLQPSIAGSCSWNTTLLQGYD